MHYLGCQPGFSHKELHVQIWTYLHLWFKFRTGVKLKISHKIVDYFALVSRLKNIQSVHLTYLEELIDFLEENKKTACAALIKKIILFYTVCFEINNEF